ncbi:cytochrome P450 2H2-like [Haliotis rufescens]|uniref:cytochrome P450 2H2-like n=1 Tax=Haliotis rufescens TaxID=6454 RepID=UPI001EB07D46|nr:cytochrome P450 2H2-like [Haliotis rufescens]
MDQLTQMICDNVTTTLIVVGSVLVAVWHFSRRHSQLPPGPRLRLPLFGNMFSVTRGIREALQEWRKDYGDIFCLYLGQRRVVVLNGYDVINESLVTHGHLFVKRPDLFVSEYPNHGRGVLGTAVTVGLEQQRIADVCLRGFTSGSGKDILEIRTGEEVNNLLRLIKEESRRNLDLRSFINFAVTNVTCSILFGKRFEDDDPLFVEYLKRRQEDFSLTAILEFMPYLRYLPGDIFNIKRLAENVAFTEDEIIKPSIKRHEKDFDDHNVTLVSAFLKECQNLGLPVNDDHLVNIVADLLIAGSEPTAVAIQWGILYFIAYPDVQDRVYQEIKQNVGLHRVPNMSDMESLPYVQATISEVLRCVNVNPYGARRFASRDVMFRGYLIPEDTMIVPVLESALFDQEHWDNPEEFKPERFLNEEGHFVKHKQWIPFSIGQSSCLGEQLATLEMFLFLSAMIQQFRFRKSEKSKSLSFNSDTNLSFRPYPKCVQLIDRHRVSEHRNNIPSCYLR